MDGWKSTRIGNIATLKYGKSLPADARVPGKVPVYGSNGIVGWHDQAIVNSPGIIVGRKGTVGAVHYSSVPFCPIDTTYFIAQDDSSADLRFLAYLLHHAKLSRLVSDLVPGLNRDSALARIVSIPKDRNEQRQIAAVLSAVQQAIERQEGLIALTAEFKKALMQKLFTEGTRGEPQKESEFGPVPESWIVAPVGELCDLVSGGTPSKTNTSFWRGTIPWASPKDMKLSRLADTQDHVTQAGVDEGSRLVPPGSIFVVIRGMILMRDVPVAQATVPMAFNQDMKALINLRGVASDFMLYSLQNARDRLLNKVGLSAHGTRTLMTSAIEQLLVALPSAAEQKLISEVLRLLEDKSANHHRTRASLLALFRTLLHELMTAQIRVHNLDLSALAEVAQEPVEAT